MTADDLTPAQRIEIQDFLLLRWEKARTFQRSGQPERRKKHEMVTIRPNDTSRVRGNGWPHTWFVNDSEASYRRNGGIPGI